MTPMMTMHRKPAIMHSLKKRRHSLINHTAKWRSPYVVHDVSNRGKFCVSPFRWWRWGHSVYASTHPGSSPTKSYPDSSFWYHNPKPSSSSKAAQENFEKENSEILIELRFELKKCQAYRGIWSGRHEWSLAVLLHRTSMEDSMVETNVGSSNSVLSRTLQWVI